MQTAIFMQLKFYELFFFLSKQIFNSSWYKEKNHFEIQAYGFFFIFLSHVTADRHDVIQLFTLRC